MFIPGLVSITFRKLTVEQIIDLCVESGVKCIEWGGDVHVPPTDPANAARVGKLTAEAGLQVGAYGSYYRCGEADNTSTFEQVVEAAKLLNAPTIRVWAGKTEAFDASSAVQADWDRVIADLRKCCDIAAAAGLTVTVEYHGHTLTATNESALRLIKETNHPALRSGWQPAQARSVEECIEGLNMVLPHVSTVHCFYWSDERPPVRFPLADGKAKWAPFLEILAADGKDHAVMVEFVLNDDPEQFKKDAAALLSWL